MNGPDVASPDKAAIAGTVGDLQNFPFEYLINALSQEGGKATIDGKTYDFTGQGTADIQNQMSDQMAQTLLDIQRGLGPEFIAQRLADLKLADPNGYAARQQLFDSIMAEANSAAPNAKLSESTQQSVLDELHRGARLDPKQLEQVQQGVRGNQIARGNYLGNAATQQEAEAVVGAGEAQQAARQGAAGNYLASGVSPSDIEYRKLQQDLSNLGSFLSNQTPTAQFGSLSGAQNQGAPTPPTGYNPMTLNPGQSAGNGVSNAFDIYGSEVNWANNQANPFSAGLSLASNFAGAAFGLGYNPWSTTRPTAPSVSADNPAGAFGGY